MLSQKFDMSVLKKENRRAIISQIKNWIASWVNYCETEEEYLKSFALFNAFMSHEDVKEVLGEAHSYIMDIYITKTWLQKKDKLALYKRVNVRNFDQCTSCPAEHDNSSMKWGEMVVNPQQHMHKTADTINKKSNSRFAMKEGHDAKALNATQMWSLTATNQLVSKYAEGMISFQWCKKDLYMSIRIDSRTWWVMLIIMDGDVAIPQDASSSHPRFRRIQIIHWDEHTNCLLCSCGYFNRIGLPCRHIFHITGKICITDVAIRWHKSYNYHFGKIARYTQKVAEIQQFSKVFGVPFTAPIPTITSPVYINCSDIFYFDWVRCAISPRLTSEEIPRRPAVSNNFGVGPMGFEELGTGVPPSEYSQLLSQQSLTSEYADAIHLATTPQGGGRHNPYRFHLESYKQLTNYARCDPKASDFLGSLLQDNLQKMVEFTRNQDVVAFPLSQSTSSRGVCHGPTSAITKSLVSSHNPTSVQRKCKRNKRYDETRKKTKK